MPAARPDIHSEADIQTLIDAFYARVNQDPLLAPVFNDVARTDWPAHLPRMYAFWSSLLLGTARYQGQPFAKHRPLPIAGPHFERWLALFTATVDAHFAGPVAELAKQRAASIGAVFEARMRPGTLSLL